MKKSFLNQFFKFFIVKRHLKTNLLAFLKSNFFTVQCMAVSLTRLRRDSTPDEFELPANASAVLSSQLRTGFS